MISSLLARDGCALAAHEPLLLSALVLTIALTLVGGVRAVHGLLPHAPPPPPSPRPTAEDKAASQLRQLTPNTAYLLLLLYGTLPPPKGVSDG